MLMSEGYKMFRGTATISPVSPYKPYDVHGDWLYKPEYECWYVNGNSYPDCIVKNIREDEPLPDVKSTIDALKDVVVNAGNLEEVKQTGEVLYKIYC